MSIPAVKLIPVPAIAQVPAMRSPQPQPALADLRWSRVEEFLRSRDLRHNTRKAYEREFKAFLGWTDKGWQDITGIKNAHPHQGRHTVATAMVTRGMDPLLAMQITRHKSAKSFERYSGYGNDSCLRRTHL